MVNRRGFLAATVHVVLGAVGAVLAVVAGGAVLRVPARRDEGAWVDVEAAEAVGAHPREVAFTVEREDGYRSFAERRVAYLARAGSEVVAFSATCTHLGCRVAWHDAERAFRCPCHGGRFGPDGEVTAGPPARPLDRLEARVENGRVLVRA